MRAGDGFGDSAEGGEDLAPIREAAVKHRDLELLAFVEALQDATRRGQTLVWCKRCAVGNAGGSGGYVGVDGDRVGWRGFRFGRAEAQVGIVGQCGSALAGTLGQVAFSDGLQTPGD